MWSSGIHKTRKVHNEKQCKESSENKGTLRKVSKQNPNLFYSVA